MAITILTEPAKISFSKNPQTFEFRSDRSLIDPGSIAISYLYFYNAGSPGFEGPEEDSIMILKVFGVVESFTFKPGGNGIGNLLPTKTTSESDLDWYGRIVDSLNRNFTIRTRYGLSITSGIDLGEIQMVIGDTNLYIRFESLDKDTRANIELNNEKVNGVGFAASKIGSNPEYEKNLRIYAELWANISGTRTKLMGTAMPTDDDGNAIWDVSLPISSSLDGTDNFKENINSTSAFRSNPVSYTIKFTEVINNLLGEYYETEEKEVISGGLPIDRLHTSLLENILENGLCNWLIPQEQTEFKILDSQPLWLGWVNLTEETQVEVTVKLNYRNGSTWLYTHQTIDLPKYQKIIVPVDMNSLQVNGPYPEYEVISYEVYLKHGGIQLSNIIKYVIERRHIPFATCFLYHNSYGSPQTWISEGRKSLNYALEKSTSKFVSSKSFNLLEGIDHDFDIKLRRTYKINTGFKTKIEIEALRDFFLSDRKYIQLDGQWIPINLSTDTIEEQTDGDNLFALTFDVAISHLEENWG